MTVPRRSRKLTWEADTPAWLPFVPGSELPAPAGVPSNTMVEGAQDGPTSAQTRGPCSEDTAHSQSAVVAPDTVPRASPAAP